MVPTHQSGAISSVNGSSRGGQSEERNKSRTDDRWMHMVVLEEKCVMWSPISGMLRGSLKALIIVIEFSSTEHKYFRLAL